MKKIIVLVCLSLNLSAQKQTLDSSNIVDEVNYMKYCMGNHHKAYIGGVSLVLSSLVVSGIAVATKQDIPVIYGTAAILGVVGTITIINANKWFKRASVGLNGKGMIVTYTFK